MESYGEALVLKWWEEQGRLRNWVQYQFLGLIGRRNRSLWAQLTTKNRPPNCQVMLIMQTSKRLSGWSHHRNLRIYIFHPIAICIPNEPHSFLYIIRMKPLGIPALQMLLIFFTATEHLAYLFQLSFCLAAIVNLYLATVSIHWAQLACSEA